jgi:pSer/pThr/pTyr-binding forkhead associated (FHA) protein
MNVFLEPVSGKGLKIPIDKAIIFIGRHPDCDVVITRSRMISRKHCALVQINDTLVIRDLGSTNGVRVNGHRVRKETRFSAGDTVTIGDLDYVVKAAKTAEPERRLNRDHPQDARAAGASPLRVKPAAEGVNPYSREIPVAIPEEEEAFDGEVIDAEAVDSDTPDSFPLISERELAERADADRSSGQRHGYPDGESHIPLTE